MKKNMSKVSLNPLNNNQKEILAKLSPFFEKEGVLAGGTALMLQFYYRKSYDFDIFFPYQIPGNYIRLASKTFNRDIKVLINNTDELTFTVLNEIKVSFIYFPFKRKYRLLKYNSITISSYKDIASDKAYAIGRRPAYRDYIDLFFILKEKFPLNQIIVDAREKFCGEFSEKLFLSQLLYFEDLKDFIIDFARKKYTKEEVLIFFQQQITDYKNAVFN
ncbi:MAG: nucleotidyl transferase AbiEii/AbiGii toxin family protein [Actinobacteria bacterium]|nr:nucleotidyl transferase AbiEii/AbiGii toxin family protein [Actinomycetota bacterium]